MQSTSPLVAEALATRTQQVVDDVRLEILRNVLPPGTRITEEGLAERYGFSRTPVREALRMLTRESLLIHVPRAYYEVASVNLDEMDDLYGVRVALEDRIAERITRREATGQLNELLAFWSVPPPAGRGETADSRAECAAPGAPVQAPSARHRRSGRL